MDKRVTGIDLGASLIHCAAQVPGGSWFFSSCPVSQEALHTFFRMLRYSSITHVGTERPFSQKNTGLFRRLAVSDALVHMAVRREGMVDAVVPASTWQKAMLRYTEDEGRLVRDTLKQRSRLLTELHLGYYPGTVDHCDAYCIAQYMLGAQHTLPQMCAFDGLATEIERMEAQTK